VTSSLAAFEARY